MSASISGGTTAIAVRFLCDTKAKVLAGGLVAGGLVVSAVSGGPSAVPVVAVVVPIVAGAQMLLMQAVKLIDFRRLVADDEAALAVFESVLMDDPRNFSKVEIIACTETAESFALQVLGSIDTDFCHDYVLVVVTRFQDANDLSAAGDGDRATRTRKDMFEVHFLDDGKVHIHMPPDDDYQVDADAWYAKARVPTMFAATNATVEAPKLLLMNALGYAFRFAVENQYDIQRYNCHSFVKTVVQSLQIDEYRRVVDPSIRMWKAFADGWLRVTGYYDKKDAEEKAAAAGEDYVEEVPAAPGHDIYEARIEPRAEAEELGVYDAAVAFMYDLLPGADDAKTDE